jgi:hypothetical protein
MAAQASQAELNKFVKVVDEFKAKLARLKLPETRRKVYASGNQKMITDYENAVSRGNALNGTIAALVGAWAAFKRGYKTVTDQTSMVIGDAIDEIRSWFGYKPMGCYDENLGYSAQGEFRPLDIDADLYGRSYSGLSGLGAAPLAAIPAAVAVAGVISAALILNSLMDKIFVSLEANAIQKENPTISRGAALAQAERGLPSLLPGGLSMPMIAAGAIALWFVLGKK